MQVEIVNPQGNVSYRRPHNHPDVLEALNTAGYSVRGAEPAKAAFCAARGSGADELLARIKDYPGNGSALLADMQRVLLWMEHENRVAEREERMGGWLSDHTRAMREWDDEYQRIRDAYVKLSALRENGPVVQRQS